jgi:hypothetical protein
MHSIYKMRFFHFDDFILLWSVHQWNGVSDPPEFFIMRGKERREINPSAFSFLLRGQKLNSSRESIQRLAVTKQHGNPYTTQSTWECRHWDVSKG